jgi:hypothetical protein
LCQYLQNQAKNAFEPGGEGERLAILFRGFGIEVSSQIWIVNWRKNHVLPEIYFVCGGAGADANCHDSDLCGGLN